MGRGFLHRLLEVVPDLVESVARSALFYVLTFPKVTVHRIINNQKGKMMRKKQIEFYMEALLVVGIPIHA